MFSSSAFKRGVLALVLVMGFAADGGVVARPAGRGALAGVKVKRDVWAPPVTYPGEGTVWMVGSHHNVTWYTANPPAQVTNTKGAVLLRTPAGFVQGRGSLGEPLASNFSIYDGRVEIEVPDVPGGTEYQIVLFGDSGNTSPFFTISNPMLAPM